MSGREASTVKMSPSDIPPPKPQSRASGPARAVEDPPMAGAPSKYEQGGGVQPGGVPSLPPFRPPSRNPAPPHNPVIPRLREESKAYLAHSAVANNTLTKCCTSFVSLENPGAAIHDWLACLRIPTESHSRSCAPPTPAHPNQASQTPQRTAPSPPAKRNRGCTGFADAPPIHCYFVCDPET